MSQDKTPKIGRIGLNQCNDFLTTNICYVNSTGTIDEMLDGVRNN